MSCAIVINKMSGNSSCLDETKLLQTFCHTPTQTFVLDGTTDLPNVQKFNQIVVCGGDGTLNFALNHAKQDAEIFYLPFGTFNEKASCAKMGQQQIADVGVVNGRRFSYVFATGVFAKLGYAPAVSTKKRLKRLAYAKHVFAEYKVHRIDGTAQIGNKTVHGPFCLVMALDSHQCFGFKFNKCYQPNDGQLSFLLIKSPTQGGFLGKVQMFFPLFRAFFLGFSKPYFGKNLVFCNASRAQICLQNAVEGTLDGEKLSFCSPLNFSVQKRAKPITVFSVKHARKICGKR
ncbi:MAG: hypothetical protein IJF10_05330 [Clostridia bacterium]|nr:hypothetical protein [Clostridia bacterium]